MITAVNRTQGRAANDGGMFGRAVVLADDETLLNRLRGQVSEFSTISVEDHVRAVAAVVTQAKRAPFNVYAKASL